MDRVRCVALRAILCVVFEREARDITIHGRE
jgi:hypothetical protein